jgi:hypothetical protein
MNNKSPVFSIFCIDYRFDAMVANFYEGIGREYDYFACVRCNAIGNFKLRKVYDME